MAASQEEILETISNMSVMEVVDLISAMEEKFGVTAAAAVAAAPAAAPALFLEAKVRLATGQREEARRLVVTACREAGAGDVVVTDNPINDPASCFRLTGIGPAAEAAGGRVVLPTADQFAGVSLAGARLIRDWPVLVGPLAKADCLIGVAPLKDHHRSGASMTVKNWYGLLGGRRNVFHQDIHTIIVELAALVRQTLVILDAVTAMMHNGPTGGSISDLADTNTLVAGIDPVAVDAAGAEILGRRLDQLPHLQQAADAGLGTLDYRTLNPVDVP